MSDLRVTARQLFQAALVAADPRQALRRHLAQLPVAGANGGYVLVAIGKAAVPMAEEALARLSKPPKAALIVTNDENARAVAGALALASSHPVPDARGEAAAHAVEVMLAGLSPKDRVIALISGGASALLPAPAPGLTLADKIAVNRLLLASGADIVEMNLIRQQLSRLKGGGLLRAAAPAPVTAFILSDVIGDDLRVIGSGPTVAPIGTRSEARERLMARGIWAQLPPAVRAHLEAPPPPQPPLPEARNILISSNRIALEAIVSACEFQNVMIASDALIGDVSEAVETIVKAGQNWDGHPRCLVFGGETTVRLTGAGRGGRNQELALRMAFAQLPGRWLFLSGGTDGRDGPTDAAGGFADAGTLARIRAAGFDPAALLANNDSHAALAAAGDLLITGGTGTNVADVQILLQEPEG